MSDHDLDMEKARELFQKLRKAADQVLEEISESGDYSAERKQAFIWLAEDEGIRVDDGSEDDLEPDDDLDTDGDDTGSSV